MTRNRLDRLRARWQHLSPNARGAVWISAGTVLGALNDVVVKFLGQSVHPVQMTFFRYAVGLILLSPLFLRMGREVLVFNRAGLHIARALCAAAGQACVYYGVTHLLLADSTAIAFSRMLFTTVLAVVVLREVVSGRRWSATIAGFIGVVVMMRPGWAALDPAALAALLGALLFAIALVFVPKLATTEPPDRILFHYHLLSMIFIAGPAALVWTAPTLRETLFLLAIGAITSLSIVCFIRAFAQGESSVVGPMEYVRLVYAAVLGFFIFGEIPDAFTFIGAAIIIASTLVIARYETAERGRGAKGKVRAR